MHRGEPERIRHIVEGLVLATLFSLIAIRNPRSIRKPAVMIYNTFIIAKIENSLSSI